VKTPTQIQRHYGATRRKSPQLLQGDLLQKITFSQPPKEQTHTPKIPPHVLLRFLNYCRFSFQGRGLGKHYDCLESPKVIAPGPQTSPNHLGLFLPVTQGIPCFKTYCIS
jgi:hypothetical protein